jgi:ABC-type bacteriocin/lantibiotic exporter with double-glycine peptidase domain
MSPAKVKTLFDKVKTNFEGKKLDYLIGHQAKNLSTGQKQCLRLLNAIGSSASVVVLDEPCSGLDPTCKKTMMDLILDMSTEKIVLVITHDQELKNLESNKKVLN